MTKGIIAGVSAALVLFGLADLSLADTKFKMSTKIEVPGKKKLQKTEAASRDYDPENPANEVVKFETSSAPVGIGVLAREVKPSHDVKVWDLKNMISLKYYLVDRPCGAGSPRFQIRVESSQTRPALNGVANIFGYVGDQPFGGNCPMGQWVYEDMTNATPKWELSQFLNAQGNPFTPGQMFSFQQVIDYFEELDPDHRVVGCSLVDDAGFEGTAYFDQVQCWDSTMQNHADTAK